MALTNPNDIVTEERLSEFYQGILPYLGAVHGSPPKPAAPVVYGIRILRDESVPSSKVEYLEDAVGMTPAHMDYTNNVFDYGSWENAFFMPKPCMLKYDGTVDYYLDPNDYTKKEDGTASDVANTSYGGNAMMEWPKIWLKIVPDATKYNKQADIFISNVQVDSGYTDWSYHNSAGNSVDHFYTGIYPVMTISSKSRSLSGNQSNTQSAQDNLTNTAANNPSGSLIWTPDTIADVTLINVLLILIGKSTDTGLVFGPGVFNGGSSDANNRYRFGAQNAKGLFYGTNSSACESANTVKVFGMEGWWGMRHRWCFGEIMVNGVRKRKLTYGTEDGSTTTGYNLTGEGYVDCGVSAPSGSSGSFISEIIFTEKGMFPATMSNGSGTTYYADIMTYNNSGTMVMQHGGSGYQTASNGIGALYVAENSDGSSQWHFSGGISARPLS